MGVPKFFRWLSERYPKIIQRYGSRPNEKTYHEHFGHDSALPDFLPPPDPLSECGLKPPIDRLYIDVNGILHGCSHNNDDDEEDGTEGVNHNITHEEIFRNVCYYLDRIVTDIAQPKELVYFAIDGVAPRAKLNQQRSRRYRSGKEGEIEQTVYDAHMQAIEQERAAAAAAESDSDGNVDEGILMEEEYPTSHQKEFERLVVQKGKRHSDKEVVGRTAATTDDGSSLSSSSSKIKEIEPGRFAGKFETAIADSEVDIDLPYHHDLESRHAADEQRDAFHSNAITPGTEFFQECTEHLEAFVKQKVATDPAWKNLTIIFSGPNCPGEGEHKIMQFMREQKQLPDYNPNLRHCIMGQDGDLVILALATHEPNLVLLREQVLFEERRRTRADALAAKYGVAVYMHNPNFEFLHLNILRDYLAYEFETSNIIESSKFDLERTIDDFVFLTFIIGNDFLPHMPAMDIADEAFDLIFYTYRDRRKLWLRQSKKKNSEYSNALPYLTDCGNIISGNRLENFFWALGRHEDSYHNFKKENEDLDDTRRMEAKFGRATTPSDDIIASKEAADRKKFLEMMKNSLEDQQEQEEEDSDSSGEKAKKTRFKPVLTSGFHPKDEEDVEAISAKIGQLLQASLTSDDFSGTLDSPIDVQDFKGRYYYDKFGFSPFDADKHQELRKAYIEGLVWNLKYYYEGCVSWSWFYKFHYGPMLSDLVGVDKILEEISFEDRLGSPLKPFQQLMACLPPSHSNLLPQPFRSLMTDPSSPIAEFFPRSFVVDMNGKRWPWEATVLLPFIDSKKLLEAAEMVDESLLSEAEIARNQFSDACVFTRDSDGVNSQPFKASNWYVDNTNQDSVFRPELELGVEVPLNGFPTLRDGLIRSLWRKILHINVHGSRSRYVTSCLELSNVPEIVTVDTVAKELIGKLVYINYPHFLEAFVTGVSDADIVYRGKEPCRQWNSKERSGRVKRLSRIISGYIKGEKVTGTGGLIIGRAEDSQEDFNILLYVRPFKRLETLSCGTVVKTYAKFEIEVPFFVTAWMPQSVDSRLLNVPARLEKNPYNAAKVVLTDPDWNKSEEVPPRIRRTRLPSLLQTRRIPMRGVSTLSGTKWLPQDVVDVKAVPKQCYSTALKPMRCNRPFLSNGAMQKKTLLRSTSALGKVRSPRGRIIAAGLVVACSVFSGAVADYIPNVQMPLRRVDFLSVDSRLEGLFDPTKEDENTQQAVSLPGHTRKTPPLEFAHGTTTLSFTFKGGIIVAVDSRASLGSFVGSKTTQKVLPINSHILGTMAGGAADCSYWIRQLRSDAAFYELTNDNDRMSVARASRLLSNYLYERRGLGLSIGTMIMGFDGDDERGVAEDDEGVEKGSPPRIFYCDNTGMRIEGDLFAVGSGSTFALGILDTQRRFDMTVDEAIALGIKAIRHATFRDAYSGGFINVFLITRKDGWRRVFSEDLARLSRSSS